MFLKPRIGTCRKGGADGRCGRLVGNAIAITVTQLPVNAVPVQRGMRIAGFARSAFRTTLGTCILLKNVMDPFLMVSTIE